MNSMNEPELPISDYDDLLLDCLESGATSRLALLRSLCDHLGRYDFHSTREAERIVKDFCERHVARIAGLPTSFLGGTREDSHRRDPFGCGNLPCIFIDFNGSKTLSVGFVFRHYRSWLAILYFRIADRYPAFETESQGLYSKEPGSGDSCPEGATDRHVGIDATVSSHASNSGTILALVTSASVRLSRRPSWG